MPSRALHHVLLVLVLLVGAGAAVQPAAAEPRPNLVIILTDDMGYGDPGFMGGQNALTPELDALAASGLVFHHAYANGSVCAPTRAALMSGMVAARTGVYTVGGGGGGGRGGGGDRARRGQTTSAPATPAVPTTQALITPANVPSLDPDVITLAEGLRSAGYATGHVGKWHLGTPGTDHGPAANGFDFTVGPARGGGTKTYYAPWNLPGLDQADKGDHLTARLANEAAGFVADHADQPFFLFFSPYAVHTPIEPDLDILARVKARAPQFSDDDAAYAALTESFDAAVGRVLDALDNAGVAENTVVVFASDNGGHRAYSDRGELKGHKGTLDEGGIRVPCTVRWPGVIDAGRESDTPVILMDLYPTFLELAGARPTPGQPVDGLSWVPLLRAPDSAAAEKVGDRPLVWYQPLYATSPQGRVTAGPRAVLRRGPWKLAVDLETKDARLFDLIDDPGEERDRAGDEPAVVAKMKRELVAWQRATDAPVPTPNPDYQPGSSDDAGDTRSRRDRGERDKRSGSDSDRSNNRRNRGQR